MKKPFSQDEIEFIRFLKNESAERCKKLRTKADRPLLVGDHDFYQINSNLYVNIEYVYDYITKLTENINVLTTAIDKLPAKQEFKDTKRELKQIVREKATFTKKEMKDHKKYEKRIGYAFG
jgi:GTP-binding protein EngB required for normal cell division